ncbi:MAG TPA: glutaminyl-peptide cyclotransferase [Solimonas sp.]
MKTSRRLALRITFAAGGALLFALVACASSRIDYVGEMQVATVLQPRIVATFPHDETHFTQGLEWRDGRLLETAGGYGVSGLFEKKRANGAVLRRFDLPREVFAEGLTRIDDRLFVLTWRERIAFVFSPDFQLQRSFRYDGEGWGLTNDGAQLIMSDGSARLSFRDPETFAIVRRVDVRDGDAPVEWLNELEYARGWVLANVWQTDRIAMIDPRNGRVRAWLDLSALPARLQGSRRLIPREDVLNGIAYDPGSGHLYVTGKRWPQLFEIAIDWPALPPDAP